MRKSRKTALCVCGLAREQKGKLNEKTSLILEYYSRNDV